MNGMNDFEKELAKDIRDIRNLLEKHGDKLADMDKKLAVHKAKSAAAGAMGGGSIAGLAMLIEYVRTKLGGA